MAEKTASKFSIEKDWPIIALVAGGAAGLYFISSGSLGGSPATSSTLWPKVVGGQMGVQSRSSARSNDTGSLATQVIGDIVGQKVALAQSKDQVTIAENESQAQIQEAQDYATEEQQMMQEELQAEEQMQQNSQPQWWQYLLGGLGSIGSFFGLGGLSMPSGGSGGSGSPFGVMPPGMGVPWGIGNPGPWGWPGSSGGGGYSPFSTPYNPWEFA